MTKYGAKKVTYDGITFDSKMEKDYYIYLKELKAKGEILDFELQPSFELQPKFEKDGVKYRPIKYVADFKIYYPDGKIEIVDVKGMETTDFKLKAKIFNYKFKEALKLIKYSKIDGGWITLEDYKKAVKRRKAEKAKHK